MLAQADANLHPNMFAYDGTTWDPIAVTPNYGIDPLHVMVRAELYEPAARSLAVLRGKRINCGPHYSVMRVLARDVLRFSGLRPPTGSDPGDYRDESVAPQDLLARESAFFTTGAIRPCWSRSTETPRCT